MFDFNAEPQTSTYPAIDLTPVPEIPTFPPSEGPYDWAADTIGADSFVFKAEIELAA